MDDGLVRFACSVREELQKSDSDGMVIRLTKSQAAILLAQVESILATQVKSTHFDPFSYDPVPLDPIHSVRVRYKFIGKLEPLPYPLDE